MSPRRVLIGLFVVALWLAAMWLLYERELGGESVTLADASAVEGRSSEPFSATYAVLADDRAGRRPVGRVAVDRRPESRGGVAGELSRVDAEMPLRLRGEMQDFQIDGEIWRPYDAAAAGRLAEVTFGLRWRDGELLLDAELRDGALRGQVTADEESRSIEIPVPDDVLIESGMGANVGLSQSFSRHLAALRVGEVLRFTSFDPLTLGKSRARARCVAEEAFHYAAGVIVPAKVILLEQGALSTRLMIDADGEVLSATTPLGLEIRKIPEDEVARGEERQELVR